MAPPDRKGGPAGPRWPAWLAPLLLGLYTAGLYTATAFLQRGLFERDGYFHARLAQLLPTHGLSRAFPWTQLSTWRDRFCDKEFLYHLLMAPFAALGDEPLRGAVAFTILLSTAVLLGLWAVLRAQRVRHAAWFAFLPLATGGLFVARLGMVRSHVASMLLLVLGLHFLLARRWRALAALGFLYAWCYTVPFVLVMTAAPFALGLWLKGEGLDWRLPLAAGAGAVAGLALHPYTPLTLETFLTYLQVFRLGLQGAGGAGLELGNELYPYALPVFFDIYPLLLLLGAALPLALWAGRKRLAPGTAGLGLAALFWMGLTLRTPRFAEYSGLLVPAAWALVWRDLGPALEARWLSVPRLRWGAGLLALAVLGGFHARSLSFYAAYHREAAPPRRFTGACAWMARTLAPGETVINLYWDDFPELFYDGPRQTYLWGLDPTYSLRDDPERTLLLERFRRGAVPLDAELLRTRFGARHLVLRANRVGGHPALGRAPFREVYRDGLAVVFALD